LVEQVDGTGRLTQPPRRPPARANVIQIATDDTVIWTELADETGIITAWQPSSGRTARSLDCAIFLSAARNLVLSGKCNGSGRVLELSDPLDPAAARAISLPAGYVYSTGAALSADGRYLALGMQHLNRAGTSTLGVLNLHTSRWTLARSDEVPSEWAADGSYLLLRDPTGDPLIRPALWSFARPTVRMLRVHVGTTATLVPSVDTSVEFAPN
jgi:hypothetical protein